MQEQNDKYCISYSFVETNKFDSEVETEIMIPKGSAE
jgi:hypothetical protein